VSVYSLSSDAPLPSFDSDPVTRHVCDYATYMRLLAENADLQRSYRVLMSQQHQAGEDKESSSSRMHQQHHLSEPAKVETLETELKIVSATNKDLEALLEGRDVDLTLVEEKRQLHHLNVGLAEKIASMRETEAAVVEKMTDAKEQAELLEFREADMLELLL
jgi:hypothetical protein